MRIISMRILLTLLASVFAHSAWAQGALEREHPRVSELQDKMTDYARGYLQTRLQGVPFMVTVKIEPIRRQLGSKYEPQNEKLPYFDLAEEEIRDEWDDPSASIYVLQSRIQKATVMLSLPQALKDYEVQEIKDTLMTLLRLIPGRDDIKIEQRSWSLGATFWYYVMLASSLLALMLIGLVFISRSWAKRLANAIHDIKPKDRAEGEAPTMAPVNMGAAGGPGGATGSTNTNTSGDLKFRDPLKTREFVHSRVAELVKNPNFPNLQAMIEMDRLADRLPRDFGALMMEFAVEKQKELFSLSFKPTWLTAFSEPGELTTESLELLDRLSRIQYSGSTKEWEQLIIQVWRQGPDRVKFLKSLSKDEAFCVLKSMPVSVAVPAARQAFPGAWAVLLDPTFVPAPLTAGRVKEVSWYAVELKPALDFSALERYRQEKDLLDYLVVSTIPEEKDIYGALPKDSFLWQVRPPFYQVLEASGDSLKKVFDRVNMDDWALALFNVSRDYRRPIEDLFNSKQKFLFSNKMRTIEQMNVERTLLGRARERIARTYVNLSLDQTLTETEAITPETDTENDGKNDETAA
jgi:hypothetical protein